MWLKFFAVQKMDGKKWYACALASRQMSEQALSSLISLMELWLQCGEDVVTVYK